MIASGYSIHAYCETCNRLGEFNEDETLIQALRTAKKRGWIIEWAARRAWCPMHRKEALEALGIGTVFSKGPRWGKAV